MEKNLESKQEQLIKTFKLLTDAMPLLQTEEAIRMSFAYVFTREPEPTITPVGTNQDPRVAVLKELRLRSGVSQEKASLGIGKAKTFVLRLETGKASIDKSTEKKLMDFYKKQEEEIKKE